MDTKRDLLEIETGLARHDKFREAYPQMLGTKKLFLEQRLELARLGTMRIITLKENILKLKTKTL